MTDTLAFTGAGLLERTVAALADRAPAIVAAAADQMRGIRLPICDRPWRSAAAAPRTRCSA